MLPIESHVARFQLIEPLCWRENYTGLLSKAGSKAKPALSLEETELQREMCAVRPIAIVLAGTGEQGFSRRRQLLSYPLAKLGVASLVLESPYYGSRRPAGQVASKLRKCVSVLRAESRAGAHCVMHITAECLIYPHWAALRLKKPVL